MVFSAGKRLPVRDLLATTLLLGSAIILGAFFRSLEAFDTTLLLSVNQLSNPILDSAFYWIVEVGSLPFWLLITLFLWLRRSYRPSALLLVGLAVDSIVTLVFKMAVNRPRPYEVFQSIRVLDIESGGSLPSGHTERSFMAATTLSRFYPKYQMALITVGLLVAFTRVYTGAHYPLDTLVGALNGTALGLILRNLRLERVEVEMSRVWGRLIGIIGGGR